MNTDEVKAIVDDSLPLFSDAMGLDAWNIRVEYDEGHSGNCVAEPMYKRALITLNPACLDTKTEVLFTLRHELLHVTQSGIQAYRLAVGRIVSGQGWDVLEEVYQQQAEDLVNRAERMLDMGLGMKPSRMIQRWRSRA